MRKTIIKPVYPDTKKISCRYISGKKIIADSYSAYLSDESKYNPDTVEKIYFPENTLQVSFAVKNAVKNNYKITISGGRTGITGGSVPKSSETLLSLENFSKDPEIFYNKKNKSFHLSCGAAMKLSEINDFIKNYNNANKTDLFYPVDPTETSASAGGMISTNASGARTFYYGATRNWVYGITVVLSDGSILKISRGEYLSQNKKFLINIDGVVKELKLSDIKIPAAKHNAGYFIKEKMDLIDLFIGSEGTLGIITECVLKLTDLLKNTLYLTIFLKNNNYLKLTDDLKKNKIFKSLAIEFFDEKSIRILKKYRKEQKEASGVPNLPEKVKSIIYTEIVFKNKKNFDAVYLELDKILKKNTLSSDLSWAGFSSKTSEEMKKLRHAIPERVNLIIAERKIKINTLTKVGTDMALPDKTFPEMMKLYKSALKKSRLEFCIFGHIGDNHLHINILPKTLKELAKAKELYKKLAVNAVKLGGSVSAEHGIGKLKKDFLKIQFSDQELAVMKEIKRALDPENILNPEVLW